MKYTLLVGDDLYGLHLTNEILSCKCPPELVVIGSIKKWQARLKYEFKNIRKNGFMLRFSQILGSITYRLIYLRKNEKKIISTILWKGDWDELKRKAKLCGSKLVFLEDENYSSKLSLDSITQSQPDYLICLTPFWISKKVREISKFKKTIGSHPGLTQFYRGSSSSFYCSYERCEHLNGFSIFYLDAGVDSGNLILQGKVPYLNLQSHKVNDSIIINAITSSYLDIIMQIEKNKSLPMSQKQPKNMLGKILKSPGFFRIFNWFFLRNNQIS